MKHRIESTYLELSRGGGATVDGRAAPLAERNDAVLAWALWGAIWTVIALNALGRWVVSEQFGPAPILPGDSMAKARLVGLRLLELVSTCVVLQCLWQWAIKPWLRQRRVTLEALLLLGGLIGFTADAMLNVHQLLFAFNAHSVNLGVWSAFMSFHTTGPTWYAESLLWGLPMYVYFGVSASLAGCAIVGGLRRRWAGITNASAFAIAYLFFVVADFVLENFIIRTTHAYMYVKTYEPLTVFAGTIHQFPIYESLLSAGVSLGFTMIRQSALDSADGFSFVERGTQRLPLRWQTPARALAVIGACGFLFLIVYHLPFNWLGTNGASVIAPPSYMLPSPAALP
jgi:hypothetical protein